MESLMPSPSKGAFSSPTTTQLNKVLECLTEALNHVAKKYPDPNKSHINTPPVITSDVLANTAPVADLKYDYAIVVINGFFEMANKFGWQTQNEETRNAAVGAGVGGAQIPKEREIDYATRRELLDIILKWAVHLSQRDKFAHIVFVTNDMLADDALKRYPGIKDGKLHRVTVRDIVPEDAKAFVKDSLRALASRQLAILNQPRTLPSGATEMEHLDAELDVDYVVEKLGGRFSDLRSFMARFRRGLTTHEAIRQMIDEARHNIMCDGLGSERIVAFDHNDTASMKINTWSQKQLWEAMKKIAKNGYAEWDDLIFSKIFEGHERALKALIKSNILTMVPNPNGPGEVVAAFSPLYRSAFQEMIEDPRLSLKMEIMIRRFEIKYQESKLHEIENELVQLRSLVFKQRGAIWGYSDVEPASVAQRRHLLEKKLIEVNAKLEALESSLGELKEKGAHMNRMESLGTTEHKALVQAVGPAAAHKAEAREGYMNEPHNVDASHASPSSPHMAPAGADVKNTGKEATSALYTADAAHSSKPTGTRSSGFGTGSAEGSSVDIHEHGKQQSGNSRNRNQKQRQ
eukprot:GEZU01030280.1.p1 GENE.GEZU01030280.1~~GEZU01030280.1.p1  ORF type:complete len:575 (+),score=149.75 GEZU01030280.1:481-2205(+)